MGSLNNRLAPDSSSTPGSVRDPRSTAPRIRCSGDASRQLTAPHAGAGQTLAMGHCLILPVGQPVLPEETALLGRSSCIARIFRVSVPCHSRRSATITVAHTLPSRTTSIRIRFHDATAMVAYEIEANATPVPACILCRAVTATSRVVGSTKRPLRALAAFVSLKSADPSPHRFRSPTGTRRANRGSRHARAANRHRHDSVRRGVQSSPRSRGPFDQLMHAAVRHARRSAPRTSAVYRTDGSL